MFKLLVWLANQVNDLQKLTPTSAHFMLTMTAPPSLLKRGRMYHFGHLFAH